MFSQVEACLEKEKVRLVLLESPTNPRMQICDIQAICEMAHKKGALVCVDNSILTAAFCRPLDLGADIAMTSATKFISGHSDVTGGLLAVRDMDLAKRIYFLQVRILVFSVQKLLVRMPKVPFWVLSIAGFVFEA